MIILRFCIVPSLIFIFSCRTAYAGDSICFPDTQGAIVEKSGDYVIRLINTPNSPIKTAEALFSVQASPKECFSTITDYIHYPEFMPNITKVTAVGKTDTGALYRFHFKVLLVTITYTIRLMEDKKSNEYKVHWDYVEGTVKNTTGSWHIYHDPRTKGGSLLRYRAYLDPGAFIPASVSNALTTKSLPDMITAIRKRVGNKSR